MKNIYDAAVIGAGASGLMAACALAGGSKSAALLERQPRAGRKLLATGNGRCNLTNTGVSYEKYISHTGDRAKLLEGYSCRRILSEFETLGIKCCADPEGRCYPLSNTASSVSDALRLFLSEHHNDPITDFDAVSIVKQGGTFIIKAADGRSVQALNVIFCPGGPASPKNGGTDSSSLIEQLGHSFTRRIAAITPMITDTEFIRGLKGVRAKADAALMDGNVCVKRESGEALFNDTGVSGICVMDLSLYLPGLRDPWLEFDFSQGAGIDFLRSVASLAPERDAHLLLCGIVPKALSIQIVKRALNGKKAVCGELGKGGIESIYRQLTHFSLRIKRAAGYESAQVTLGGADMREFDPYTLGSKKVKGLYIAGEICDMTGECGGYNLHWAWASALKAARAVIEGN